MHQLTGRNVASSDNSSVGNASPVRYSVPAIIAVGGSFAINFTATDPIFASITNSMKIFIYDESTGLNCTTSTTPSGVVTSTTFSGNQTFGSTPASVNRNGTFFVCFLTYDQLNYFPVPNSDGGYVFGIGNVGATSYRTYPTTPYAGQTVEVRIAGTSLRTTDVAKVVDVTKNPSESQYYSYCNDSADSVKVHVDWERCVEWVSCERRSAICIASAGLYIVLQGCDWLMGVDLWLVTFTVGRLIQRITQLPSPSFETETFLLQILTAYFCPVVTRRNICSFIWCERLRLHQSATSGDSIQNQS